MGRVHPVLNSYNQGEVSKLALTRVDNEALRLAAEQQVNWLPYVMGAMTFRPGLEKLDSTRSDAACRMIPFIFSNDDTAILEFTDSHMRVWVDDAVLANASVSTAITNGTFSASGSWTTSATSGASATIDTANGYAKLHAQAVGSSCYVEQTVSVGGGDQNVQHRLRVTVTRGPVTLTIGTSSGLSDLFSATSLGTGTHSIAFTPTGANFTFRFATNTKTTKWIDSVSIEGSGAVDLPTSWLAANLAYLRPTQSGDIVFMFCDGFQTRQIERRDNDSWSIVLHYNEGGPFQSPPERDRNIVMTPDLSAGGTQTLTASQSYWVANHVQTLVRVKLDSQSKFENLAGSGAFTKAFRVSGSSSDDRDFAFQYAGTWAGTLTRQRSLDGPTIGFKDGNAVTGNTSGTFDDSATYTNVDVWYRVGFKIGEYTSGTATVSQTYGGTDPESPQGYSRIMALNSATEVDVEYYDMSANRGSNDWELSEWSSTNVWPVAGAIFDGRLWSAAEDRLWGSVSDDYTNHDDQTEGDSGPISRTIGIGPINRINWLLPLTRLIIGCEGSEMSVRSSAFDEPVTPTNFTLKECSTQGSANLPALKIDTRGVFVEKSGRKIYELAFNLEMQDYRARDMTFLNDKFGSAGFVDLAVQRQPDTIMHFVRGDGQVGCILQDQVNSVEALFRMQTLGVVENVVVLPGSQEDSVYYVVKRTINGSTKRFLEKFALRSECVGGTLSKNLDCHTVISQASSTTISGLSYLEGETVSVWANGKDLGSYTVSSGSITVSEAVTSAVVGLGGVSFSYDSSTAAASVTCATKYNGYPCEVFADGKYVGPVTIASGIATLPNGRTAKKITAYLGLYGLFRSAKLAYGAQMGTAMLQSKKIEKVGVVAFDMHYQGLTYGSSIDNLQPLPLTEAGQDTASNTVWAEFDRPMIGLSGSWDTDSRLHLVATAPRPVTLAAAVIATATNEAR